MEADHEEDDLVITKCVIENKIDRSCFFMYKENGP
jgi:hypothetical protein